MDVWIKKKGGGGAYKNILFSSLPVAVSSTLQCSTLCDQVSWSWLCECLFCHKSKKQVIDLRELIRKQTQKGENKRERKRERKGDRVRYMSVAFLEWCTFKIAKL